MHVTLAFILAVVTWRTLLANGSGHAAEYRIGHDASGQRGWLGWYVESERENIPQCR